jgi:ATPase subunit of ABC transporter with duplicated ATPase domains
VKYNEYVELRKERHEQQVRAYENQQKEMADIRAFVERFRYQATKAVQVQQRVKQLEKIVPIEIDEVDNSAMHLKFPPCLRSGDYPVICDEVRKVYPKRKYQENQQLEEADEHVCSTMSPLPSSVARKWPLWARTAKVSLHLSSASWARFPLRVL